MSDDVEWVKTWVWFEGFCLKSGFHSTHVSLVPAGLSVDWVQKCIRAREEGKLIMPAYCSVSRSFLCSAMETHLCLNSLVWVVTLRCLTHHKDPFCNLHWMERISIKIDFFLCAWSFIWIIFIVFPNVISPNLFHIARLPVKPGLLHKTKFNFS